ncbi:MAG: hypothetical protein E7006_03425 [Alphaproteobacteria bacterium]|nr:hypothetical protein [Alphaproteobacteria bacterium]
MTIKNKFNRAVQTIKWGSIGAVVNTVIMAAVIPVGGLFAHGAREFLSDDYMHPDYSLKNRFETAYSFKTPDAHKYYHSTPMINGYSQGIVQEKYLASPYATYGALCGAGLAGAIFLGAAGLAAAKRKENQR